MSVVEYLEVARAQTERGELVLRTRHHAHGPTVWELRANGVFVMDTLETGTERALATSALALVADPGRVLVGGLGLGFTMREVLADPRVRTCAVVEIEQDLVTWMRDGTIPHGPAMLADERLVIVVADLATAFAQAHPGSYDLVLVDVDNGPGHLVHASNAALYTAPVLAAARTALSPGGVLAIWSADPAPALAEVLTEVFGTCRAQPLDVRLGERDEQYWLYVATCAAAPPG